MKAERSSDSYKLFVGIDIAAETASVAILSQDGIAGAEFTIEQTPSGMKRLKRELLATKKKAGHVLVVMEATGNYWMRLATSLFGAGFAVSIVNPTQACHFAQAILKRAKTDAIDARMLAQYARILQPQPWAPAPPIYEELLQRLSERDNLVQMRQQVRNQLHALRHRPDVICAVEQRMGQLLVTFQAQIETIEGEIKSLMQQGHAWAIAAQLLQSIPGVGAITAAWLLVATHNFTSCESPEQLAAYAGLAPYPHQSGTSVHHRSSIGHTGHARLRRALYLATLSATRYNPFIKKFYDRLRVQGKPMKVARCAAARKLIHLAWAVVMKQTPFAPDYQQKQAMQMQIA